MGSIGGGFIELFIMFADQMRQHFCIRRGVELVACFDQSVFQSIIILNDAVVDDTNPSALIKVRVRIFVCRSAVSRPASVAEAKGSLQRFKREQSRKAFFDLALFLVQLKFTCVANRDSSAVVTAILQASQTFEDDRPGLAFTEISNNSAHISEPYRVFKAGKKVETVSICRHQSSPFPAAAFWQLDKNPRRRISRTGI